MASKTLPKLPHGDGSLRFDKDRGVTELQHRIGAKRYVERGKDWRECVRKRDERRAALATPTAAGASTTLEGLFALWLAERLHDATGASPTTRRQYRGSVEHWTRELGAGTPISSIKLRDVESAMRRLVVGRPGLAPQGHASLVKLRSHLGMAFDVAVAAELLPAHSMRSATIPKMAPRTKRTPWFDRPEAARVIAHLVDHHTTRDVALLVVLLAGLRPGEAMGLRWEHVHDRDESPTLDVRSTLRRGETGNRAMIVDELKTDHTGSDAGQRTVPLPPVLVRALQRERREQFERGHAASEFVFTDKRGRHLSPNALDRTAARVSAAISPAAGDVNPNGYRHTFGSLLWDAGMSPADIAKLMGHKNPRMIVETYSHSMSPTFDTTAIFGAMAS